MGTCKCGAPHAKSHRYCLKCHAAYMRAWRKTHKLTPEQRRKMNCRSYTHTYVKRGKIVKQTCFDCQSPDVQAHHPDYKNPRLVVWLCKPHHRKLHENLAKLVRQ